MVKERELSTHYNAQQQADCDMLVRVGESVWRLQQQLSLREMEIQNHKTKIKQYEAMTGVTRAKLPEDYIMPSWEYMLKHTTHKMGQSE
jgi:hypothetical protein